jgi:hypothetical protein
MTSLDDVFVADAVSHAYNFAPSNYAVEKDAQMVVEMSVGMDQQFPPEYRRTAASITRDWDAEETANLLFRESQTDFAVFHPQTIQCFEDGLTAEYKAKDFIESHPSRTAALASVDAIGMDDPQAELTRQVEEFDPHGVKVYPSYWTDKGHQSFTMDDPEHAFPLWEHAVDLGLDVVAVHKAMPIGGVPMEPYKVGDVDEAAASFPDLNFEIVHGGLTFARETGWQLARFDNVYVNLELTGGMAPLAPKTFVRSMRDLLWAGGEAAVDQIIWGSGTPQYHPQLLLEAFWEFDFPEMEWWGGTHTITQEHKRKILGENFCEAHNFDIDELQTQIEDDEYSDQELVTEPYSTTEFEVMPA